MSITDIKERVASLQKVDQKENQSKITVSQESTQTVTTTKQEFEIEKAKEVDQKKSQEEKPKTLEKIPTDPFVSALRMAIANDGKIDKQELKHLRKLEKKTADEERLADRQELEWQPRKATFVFLGFFSPLSLISPLSLFFAFRKPRMRYLTLANDGQNQNLNHSLREAFKVSALDGKINKNEIKELKKLF